MIVEAQFTIFNCTECFKRRTDEYTWPNYNATLSTEEHRAYALVAFLAVDSALPSEAVRVQSATNLVAGVGTASERLAAFTCARTDAWLHDARCVILCLFSSALDRTYNISMEASEITTGRAGRA